MFFNEGLRSLNTSPKGGEAERRQSPEARSRRRKEDGLTAGLSAGGGSHHGDVTLILTKGRWRRGERPWLLLSPSPQFPEVPPIGQTSWADQGVQECRALRFKAEPGDRQSPAHRWSVTCSSVRWPPALLLGTTSFGNPSLRNHRQRSEPFNLHKIELTLIHR